MMYFDHIQLPLLPYDPLIPTILTPSQIHIPFINNPSWVRTADMTQVHGHPLGHGHCTCVHIPKREWLSLPPQQSTAESSSLKGWGLRAPRPFIWKFDWLDPQTVAAAAVTDMCSSHVKSRSLQLPFLLICQFLPSFHSSTTFLSLGGEVPLGHPSIAKHPLSLMLGTSTSYKYKSLNATC